MDPGHTSRRTGMSRYLSPVCLPGSRGSGGDRVSPPSHRTPRSHSPFPRLTYSVTGTGRTTGGS